MKIVVFGLRIHSERGLSRNDLDTAVEKALTETGLWNDLKDRLDTKGHHPPARAATKALHRAPASLKPAVILMDEPCSALDVEGTRAIEELMFGLRGTTPS
jgi:phosphate transport system ATP-binding protein